MKPTVLLCWGYHRSGWNEIFEKLSEIFEFHYLFFFSPRLARGKVPDEPVHFWTDFKSPYHALEKIQPKTVVFMGLDGLQTVALNIAARARGIPTLYLQHGVMLPLSETADVKATTQESDPFFRLNRSEKFHQGTFFLRSLRWKNWSALPFGVRWMLMRPKFGEQRALALNQSEHRRADWYAVYTRDGGEQLLRERDGVPSDRILEIGHPGFDDFFSYQTTQANEDYELLIDQPISGAPEIPIALKSPEEVIAFHERLSEFCWKRGTRLVVKLHPYSHGGAAPRLQSKKITYIEDSASLPALIHGSRAVYGYYSTLLLPALALKPCCLFDLGLQNSLQKTVREFDLAEVVDFESLPVSDFHKKDRPEPQMERFIRSCLFQTDGQSLLRLRELLLRLSAKRGRQT